MKRSRFPLAAAAATTAIGVVLALTASSPAGISKVPRVRVILAVGGGTVDLTVGDAVTLTATAKLPRGNRLLIERSAHGGPTWLRIEECASSPCQTDWTEPDPGNMTFRARAVHRKAVVRGRIDAVAGTSRSVVVTWNAPPPPPPPPPSALPGHYCGFNDQGKSVCLDVTPDGTEVANFVTESIVDCTDGSRWQFRTSFSDTRPITNLVFTYSYTGSLTSSNPSFSNISVSYSISGTFDTQGNASGTLSTPSKSFDYNGTHHDCSTAPFAWHAKLNA